MSAASRRRAADVPRERSGLRLADDDDSTVALTSWTAIRAAISTAVCWIGSSLSWRTRIVGAARRTAPAERVVREHDDDVGVAVVEVARRGGLVADEALRVDELVELVLDVSSVSS